jgi:hypothetical protein
MPIELFELPRLWSVGVRRVSCGGALLALFSPAVASAGEGFTLVATEENTRDMSVNLGADALRGDTTFGGRSINAPTSVVGRDEFVGLLNHDDGVLDVQHTFFVNAALSSRSLVHFQTLARELRAHCWSKEQSADLRATLRLYVIPPYGPGKHNRLWGITPTAHFPPSVDIDPAPASVPIGVFRQAAPWVEGNGQNSFFTASYDDALLLDVKRVGVAAAGSSWLGEPVQGVDVCLNRQAGLEAVGRDGQRAPLCFDPAPDWQPWVEWDVSAAVRYWLDNDFDPALDHGFAIAQYPGLTAEDQIRISPEIVGFGRSRAVVSFAASSGLADCTGAGGEWGGARGVDLAYSNLLCMSPREGDLEPNNPYGVPRFITPLARPEWAPQLVIRTAASNAGCFLSVPEAPVLDSAAGIAKGGDVVLENASTDQTWQLESTTLTGADAASFRVEAAGCRAAPLSPGARCNLALSLSSSELGPKTATLEIAVRVNGSDALSTERVNLTGTVSEDADGVADAVENLALHEGDGDQDGVPDRRESHVVSFRGEEGQSVTLSAPVGTQLTGVQAVRLTPDAELSGVQFPHGFFALEVVELAPGSAVELQLHLESSRASVYHVQGPALIESSAPWLAFGFDGATGATFDEKGVRLRLVDGGRGDSDGIANGRIRLAGGPGIPQFGGNDRVRLTDARVGVFCSYAPRPSGSWAGPIALLGACAAALVRRRRAQA